MKLSWRSELVTFPNGAGGGATKSFDTVNGLDALEFGQSLWIHFLTSLIDRV
jgi:hypothetical protein